MALTRLTKISKASPGPTPTCPKCGGSQFRARRTSLQRVLATLTLVTLPLMPKKQVQCETCGAKFRRG